MAEEKKKSSGAKRIAINQPFVEAAINRKASGKMTQHELADKIGVDRTTLYHVMKGERVSAETLVSLSLFLNEPLESLAADPKDALKVMKKVLTDDINRMEAQEIQALWALFLPFRTKKKTLREVLRESEALEQHPFKLMMYCPRKRNSRSARDLGDAYADCAVLPIFAPLVGDVLGGRRYGTFDLFRTRMDDLACGS